jgi:predicted AAA+ superfamily ATPase
VVFLDEVQYLPDPARTLKALYDDVNIQFRIVCTGSRFIGQKTLGSSMVGRGAIYPLSTFSFLEFLETKGIRADRFEGKTGVVSSPSIEALLREYRIYGGYPKVVFSQTEKEKRQALSAIIERIFTIDLPFFLSGQDLVPTRQVFQWIAENTGNMANIEQMASLFRLSSVRVTRSLDFLRESFLIRTVYPFFQDKSREYSSRPKLYLHDVGLLSYVRNAYHEPLEGDGKITETMVAHDVSAGLAEGDSLRYYKKTSGSEIDFVVTRFGQE